MKIRTWLLISYFVVMALPLVSLYLLFASVTSYQSDQKVEEYSEAFADIQTMTTILKDPKWYTAGGDKGLLDKLAGDETAIQLYNADGRNLYHSNPNLDFRGTLNREQLYSDLYQIEEGLRAYTYREPVFDDRTLVGFFEIEIARDALIDTIIKRGWIVIGLFAASFFLIYFAVSYFVNKRVTKRLYGLMDEMTVIAGGDHAPVTAVDMDEIGELRAHFDNMQSQIIAGREKIEQEQKEKELMVAAISHDLKTPLTSIKAYAEALSEPELLKEEDQHTYKRVITEKTEFIRQMLDDLVTYSLFQSQEYEMEFVTVAGDEFFEMLVSDYEALCEDNQIQLVTCHDAPGMFDVHPQQLIRVVDNLMGNAIKHTTKEGMVWLLAVGERSGAPLDWLFDPVTSEYKFDFDKNVYLIVQNEGTAIPESKMSQLFQPLYQVDPSRNKQDHHQGTGLGLSIAKQIIEKHGGDVTAIAAAGDGTCFICRLPKKEEKS